MNRTPKPIFASLSAIALSLLTGIAHSGPVEDLQPGHWYEVPNSRLSTVLPNPLPVGDDRPGRAESIIDEWSGGAYDTIRDRLIVWGGGHNNYSGNEIYAFDINTLSWSRLSNPSTNVGGVEASGYYPDGLPRSRHTYDYIDYLPPPVDRFCSFGAGAQFPVADMDAPHVDCFNFTTNQWQTGFYDSIPRTPFEGIVNSISAYDPDTGRIYFHSTSRGDSPRFMRLNPANGQWSVLADNDFINGEITAEIHAERRAMIATGRDLFNGTNDFWVWDLNNPSAGASNPNTSGDNEIENQPAPGLAWDPESGTIVAWHGGANIYTLEFNNGWVWTRRPPAATNTVIPTAGAEVGTYGRFRYVPSKNVFIVVNSVNENVYIYKLTDGQGTPLPPPRPTVLLDASPSFVPPGGGSTTLNWTTSRAEGNCTAGGGWNGTKGLSGSESVGPISTQTTYSLTCTGPGGSTTANLIVAIGQPFMDSDNDGLSDQQETEETNTDPNNPDTDGDGDSDGDEVAAGSDPLDENDTLADHRPEQPGVADPGSPVATDGATLNSLSGISDPDDNPLGSSHWQIASDQNFDDLALDRTIPARTSLMIPTGLLDASSQYWARTSHIDSTGVESEWSEAVVFDTGASRPNDGDGNGIDDRFQVDGAIDTDGNGQDDALQTDICNLKDAVNGAAIGFVTDAGSPQCFTSMAASNLPASLQNSADLPNGLFSFRINGLAESATIQVDVHFPEQLDANRTWIKFDEAGAVLENFSSNTAISGNVVTLTLTDGGAGDADGTANGTIVDPGGPGPAVAPGGSGGSGSGGGGGGGATGIAPAIALALLTLLRLSRRAATSIIALLGIAALSSHVALADITTVTVQSQTGVTQTDVPVTFGHIFKQGDVPNGSTLGARLGNGTNVPLQVDAKAFHADGTLRHAVLTMSLPQLNGNQSTIVTLFASDTPLAGTPVALNALLATAFGGSVTLNVNGASYSMSARELLQGQISEWLSGPLVSEWRGDAPLELANGTAHPHLTARFSVRAYTGVQRARISMTVENAWSLEPNPQNFVYNASVSVVGKGVVLSQNNVTHLRQARWRRVFWWGSEPLIEVAHDRSYMESTLAVPTYDQTLVVPQSDLAEMANLWSDPDVSSLMAPGLTEPFMPQGGGRADIGPLPRWAARYIVSQDIRAKRATVGTGEQAGSFPVHYRDRDTGLPISLDTYPGLTVVGSNPIFPDCAAGGDCSTGAYEPDISHQPSLAYLPYLITGDHFFLEELQFWANWNAFYWGQHGGSLGLLAFTQLRAQAWGLRTMAHAAYITPNDDPLKSYFISKVNNNLDWYNDNYSNNPPTPLGYLLNAPGLELDETFSTWMDDFFTWTVGHLVNLDFTKARPIFDYKATFPIGRLTHPDYCWILAPTYWTRSRDAGGTPYQTWTAYKAAVVDSWDNEQIGPSFGFDVNSDTFPPNMSPANEQPLLNAACGSQNMASILGLQVGETLGLPFDAESYNANLQVAVALAAELDAPGGQQAWDVFEGRTVKPEDDFSYDVNPQFALVPAQQTGPAISLSADPFSVAENGSSTLTWIATGADACTASGGWSGSRTQSGTEQIGPLTASTNYTLSCTGADGTSTRSVVVFVGGAGPGSSGSSGSGSSGSGSGSNSGSGSGSGGTGGGGSSTSVFGLLFLALWAGYRLRRTGSIH